MVQNEDVRKSFARRLKEALAQAGFAEWGAGARLAGTTGATAKAASKWLNAESMPGRANMLAISDWLGVRVEWLQYGEGEMRPSPLQSDDISDLAASSHANVGETQQPHRVAKEYPLISWVAAGSWQESCDNFQPGAADEWLASDASAGPHGYWLAVKGASMLPQFTEGMRILVRPEGFDLVSGKFYIAKLLDTGETTFKQYVRDAGLEFLQPLNNQFPTLQITDNVRIIGRVVDAKIAPSLLL
ncbi:S24 family peptidase [Pseudomonas fluvialis]|uniref:S24 family peptidase n=1 Tax=Pseudomonas fluvialis TaxID=1793966 RepID=UPI0035B1B63A